MEMEIIEGGVCAAKGFAANGVHCGIRKNKSKKDLALIYSEVPANAAAVYTTNLVKGAPLAVTKRHLAKNGTARAVICNSGNANTCNAGGEELAEETSALLAKELGIAADEVVVASTGVIGLPMSIEPFKVGIPELVHGLGDHGDFAAEGILTTDTIKKEAAVSFFVGGKECRLGGIAKGSGMIRPNMATMLVFLTTDCAVTTPMLQKALSGDVQNTFNIQHRRRHLHKRYGRAARQRYGREQDDRRGGRGFLHIYESPEYRHGLPVQNACRGRGGRLEAAGMPSLGCEKRRFGKKGRKSGDLLLPRQDGDVRRGRELGQGALRNRVQRRRRGYRQGERKLPFPERNGSTLRKRGGRTVLRRKG